MTRNNISLGEFRIEPVADFTVFNGFSCLSKEDTDRDLDEFLHQDAERHFHDKIAVTYAVYIHGLDLPLGFATLQNDAIVLREGDNPPEAIAAYHYRSFPAVKIGRFGIRRSIQRNHIGSLFLYLLKMLMCTANRTGCRFFTVDARRDKKNKVDATAFYAKNGFTELTYRDKTSKYVPMYFDLTRFQEETNINI